MKELYSKLADILEVDEVAPNDVLRDFEVWDSLTVLSIQAMLDKDYGVNIIGTDLQPITTAAELVALVKSRMNK